MLSMIHPWNTTNWWGAGLPANEPWKVFKREKIERNADFLLHQLKYAGQYTISCLYLRPHSPHTVHGLRDIETHMLPLVFCPPQDITALMATQVHHSICRGVLAVSRSSSRTTIRKCSTRHLLYPSIETQAYILFWADSDKQQACVPSPSCLLGYWSALKVSCWLIRRLNPIKSTHTERHKHRNPCVYPALILVKMEMYFELACIEQQQPQTRWKWSLSNHVHAPSAHLHSVE